MRISTLLVILGVVSTQLISSVGWSWGQAGHKIVADTGAKISLAGTEFWSKNAENLAFLSTVPDLNWKKNPTAVLEKPTHFFEIDGLVANINLFRSFPLDIVQAARAFSPDKIKDHGTALWRANQFYQFLVEALKAKDEVGALQIAGVMAHYVGDLSQPLHVTTQYDGRQKGTGIHKFFETDNIQGRNLAAVTTATQKASAALVQSKPFQDDFKAGVLQALLNEVDRSHKSKEPLLQIDENIGRTGQGATQLREMAIERMADGAATYALILSLAWKEAGNPKFAGTVDVSAPDFFPPKYMDLIGGTGGSPTETASARRTRLLRDSRWMSVRPGANRALIAHPDDDCWH